MKKIAAGALLLALFVSLAGCDLLSTIVAVKGFYTEYTDYSGRYTNATQFTVEANTDLTVTETNIADLNSMSTDLYFMIDKDSPYSYTVQTLDGVTKNSVYHNDNGLLIEYIIDGDTVTPTIPEASETQADAGDLFSMDDFSFQDVQNELKTGDHSYEFDVYLNQVVNMEKLASFADALKVFDENLTSLDNAMAHVQISFEDAESVIDIQATLTDYVITFDDESTVTFSLTNHTTMRIPVDFQMPDVFSDEYTFVPSSDVRLATKVYAADTAIVFPIVADTHGYLQFALEAGTYQIEATVLEGFGFQFVDSNLDFITFNTGQGAQVTVEAGTYYFSYDSLVNSEVTLTLTTVTPEATE